MEVAELKIRVTTEVNESIAGLRKFEDQVAKAGHSIETLRAKMLIRQQALIEEKDIAKIVIYNREIEILKNQIDKLGNAGKKGFDVLGNAATSSFGAVGNGATKAFSMVRQLAYILPGVGIAGIIGFATGPIINYIESLNLLGGKTKEQIKKSEDLKKATEAIFESVAKESGKVEGLVAILRSETETRERKLAAVKELKSIEPSIFAGLKLEGETVLGLDNAYKNYIANLRTVIAVKIKQQQLDNITADILKKEGVTQTESEKRLSEGTKKFKELQKAKNEAYSPYLEEQAKREKKETQELNKLKSDQKGLISDINELSKGIKVGAPPKISIKVGAPPKISKGEKPKDPFTVSLKDLEDNYKNALALVTGIKFLELQATADFYEKKKALLHKYKKDEGEVNLAISKNNIKILQEELRFAESQKIPLPKSQTAPNTTTGVSKGQGAANIYNTLSEDIKKLIKDQDDLNYKLSEMAPILTGTVLPVFNSVIDAVVQGNQKIGDVFAAAIKGIIAQLLKAAALAAILSLISGGGAKGFGFLASFKDLLSGGSGIIPHAEGGIFTRPTLLGNHLFGEAGPEAIVPLNRMPQFQGNSGTQVFIPEIKLRGQDLVIAFDRANKTLNRVG